MAQEIISEQQQEIQELQTILAGLTADEMDMEFMEEQMMGKDKMYAMADQEMITDDLTMILPGL